MLTFPQPTAATTRQPVHHNSLNPESVLTSMSLSRLLSLSSPLLLSLTHPPSFPDQGRPRHPYSAAQWTELRRRRRATLGLKRASTD